jgi:two-component system LytT family response regulator
MRVIIIEDESIAIRKLKKLIYEINAEIEIIAELESVFEANKWFNSNSLSEIDLLFSDIHLSDGLSFEIFDKFDFKVPIIFTTAYDEYALKAFKLNGVDYLLKPIQKEELKQAIDKFEHTKKLYSQNQLIDIQSLINQFQHSSDKYPSFISYQKDKLIPIACDNIAFFYIQNLIVCAVVDKTEFVLEETMDEIEKRLPTQLFFRANRQFIIQKKYVSNAEIYFNNRLIVHLSVKTPEDIIISREKTAFFKNWLTGA